MGMKEIPETAFEQSKLCSQFITTFLNDYGYICIKSKGYL